MQNVCDTDNNKVIILVHDLSMIKINYNNIENVDAKYLYLYTIVLFTRMAPTVVDSNFFLFTTVQILNKHVIRGVTNQYLKCIGRVRTRRGGSRLPCPSRSTAYVSIQLSMLLFKSKCIKDLHSFVNFKMCYIFTLTPSHRKKILRAQLLVVKNVMVKRVDRECRKDRRPLVCIVQFRWFWPVFLHLMCSCFRTSNAMRVRDISTFCTPSSRQSVNIRDFLPIPVRSEKIYVRPLPYK
jgi:hypothetical protein